MEQCIEAMLCQTCGLELDAPEAEVETSGCPCECHVHV